MHPSPVSETRGNKLNTLPFERTKSVTMLLHSMLSIQTRVLIPNLVTLDLTFSMTRSRRGTKVYFLHFCRWRILYKFSAS